MTLKKIKQDIFADREDGMNDGIIIGAAWGAFLGGLAGMVFLYLEHHGLYPVMMFTAAAAVGLYIILKMRGYE